MRRGAAILAALASLAAGLQASGEAAIFRVVQAGARPAALSGALAASGGLDAAGVNPAAAAWIEGPVLSASHASILQDLFLEDLDAALPTALGVFSAHGLLLHAPDMAALDAQGRQVGVLASREGAYGLGWALAVGGLAFGAQLHHLERDFGQQGGNGQAADVGLQARLPLGFSLGLALRGVGALSVLGSDADPLQGELSGAAAWRRLYNGSESVELMASLSRNGSGDLRGSLALELGLAGVAYLRGGTDLVRPAGQSGAFSAGVGARLGSVALDAAWVPFGELGDGYRLTASFYPSSAPAAGADPAAPWGLRLEPERDGAWRLSWRAPTGKATASYRIYSRSLGTGGLTELTKKPYSGTSVRFKSLAPGSAYHFSVSAVDAEGREGPLSREVMVDPVGALNRGGIRGPKIK